MDKSSTPDYRDTSRLSAWVIGMLAACAFASVFCLFTRALEVRWLGKLRDGLFLTQKAVDTAATESDFRIMIASGFLIATMLITFILVAVWIYRVSYNAHRFDALGMRYSPVAAVGWYFVPLFNLWKPYEAMSEIWRVSQDPEQWHTQQASNLVAVWWMLWIFMLVADRAHNVVMRKDVTVDMYMLASKLGMVDDVALAAASLALAFLVRSVQELQQNTVASQIAQAIPLDEAS